MRRTAVLAIAIPIGIYTVLAVLAFLPVAPFSSSALPQCTCADYAKMTAFLEWTPWAILHGNNPFFTTYQDWPRGVNLASNTTMPFVGLVMAPVTLTAGPIVAMNIVARIALAASATTAFLAFRRFVAWTPAAFLGGLLFGFSPYMFAHAEGHANLIFVVFVPLLFLLGDEIFVRQKLPARRAGLLLGLTAIAQFGASTEMLADAGLVAMAALLYLVVVHRNSVRACVAHALRSLAWSLAVLVPVVAYPMWMVIAGPGHLSGPAQPLGALNPLRSDLLGALLPTRGQLFSFGHLGVHSTAFVAHNLTENATYLGLPLIVFLVGAAIAYRRNAVLMFAAVMVVCCFVASLGSTLNFNGASTGIPLPFRILQHLPLLDSAIAVRFFGIGYLFVGLALAVALAEMRASWLRRSESADVRRQQLRTAVCLALGIAVMIPLIPRLPLSLRPSGPSVTFGSYAVPAYFSQNGGEQSIPAGSTILVYPYTTQGFLNYSVLWQAVGGERFRLTDGDATIPGPDGVGTASSPQLDPPQLENLLLDAYFGRVVGPSVDELRAGAVAEMRLALRRYHFSAVVVDPVGADPSAVIAWMTALLGQPPVRQGGVYAWYGVQRDLSRLQLDGVSRSRPS